MSKKIAIVSLGYFWFPCESGPSRFYQIATTFVKNGYEVEVITTDFQHFKKIPRDKGTILSQGYPFKITFIETMPYKKNIDPRRVISNRLAEKKVRAYLSAHMDDYDAVYVSIPANNIAAAVTTICKEHDVPCVVDIEDLWPEAMSMVIKSAAVRKVLLQSFFKDAETTYANCSGVIGTSEDYTARAFQYKKRQIPSSTVYVGCNLEDFDEGVREFREEVKKLRGEFWVSYAGSISTSYDIRTLLLAAQDLLTSHPEIRVQILGTGSQKDELESFAKENKISNVTFWGFTAYPKMAAVLDQSDLVINSFIKGAPQSIVNKVGDYLASGKAMINTLENPEFCRLVENNRVGINVPPENKNALAHAIVSLENDEARRAEMGRNARRLAENDFNRESSYQRIVDLTEQCIENKK